MARAGSLSAKYGCREFPLHTDTAFWPIPVRFLVLRVIGDTRRCSTVRLFEDLFMRRDELFRLAQRSVWLARTGWTSFYCSMMFRSESSVLWRYDSNCMFPANSAAKQLEAPLRAITSTEFGEQIKWSGSNAVIFSNWTVLHGRCAAPEAEGERIVERIYVR